jgi:hypothetical protein
MLFSSFSLVFLYWLSHFSFLFFSRFLVTKFYLVMLVAQALLECEVEILEHTPPSLAESDVVSPFSLGSLSCFLIFLFLVTKFYLVMFAAQALLECEAELLVQTLPSRAW